MVSASPLIRVIAGKLKEYQAENIVVDPVMVATSGAKLISDEAVLALKEELLPMQRCSPQRAGGGGPGRDAGEDGSRHGDSGKVDQ